MAGRDMIPAYVVEITTPKQYLLRGLLFGPKRPKNAFIFVHGLGGSAFSLRRLWEQIVGQKTAVLALNNRGFESLSTLRRKTRRDSERNMGGSAHEVFTDCVDDIQGAIRFLRNIRAKNIFLIGHSTGCQKSIYWAHKKKGKGVKGIVLLGPVSDYEAELHRKGERKLARATTVARRLVQRGNKHELLPTRVWHEVLDAQRFISLYTPHTPENTFPYGRPEQIPRALWSVEVPILVIWAGNDEYADRPAIQVARWFEKHVRNGRVVVIPRVRHSFRGGEKAVAREIHHLIRQR
jgi:pimeloyl-ACP methyl ester carboxylesterase